MQRPHGRRERLKEGISFLHASFLRWEKYVYKYGKCDTSQSANNEVVHMSFFLICNIWHFDRHGFPAWQELSRLPLVNVLEGFFKSVGEPSRAKRPINTSTGREILAAPISKILDLAEEIAAFALWKEANVVIFIAVYWESILEFVNKEAKMTVSRCLIQVL